MNVNYVLTSCGFGIVISLGRFSGKSGMFSLVYMENSGEILECTRAPNKLFWTFFSYPESGTWSKYKKNRPFKARQCNTCFRKKINSVTRMHINWNTTLPVGQAYSKMYLPEEEAICLKYTFRMKNTENFFSFESNLGLFNWPSWDQNRSPWKLAKSLCVPPGVMNANVFSFFLLDFTTDLPLVQTNHAREVLSLVLMKTSEIGKCWKTYFKSGLLQEKFRLAVQCDTILHSVIRTDIPLYSLLPCPSAQIHLNLQAFSRTHSWKEFMEQLSLVNENVHWSNINLCYFCHDGCLNLNFRACGWSVFISYIRILH